MSLALALALALAPGAAEGPGQLEWQAPLECPDRAWLRARVAAYLGHDHRGEDDAQLEIHARVEPRHGLYVLELAVLVAGVEDRHTLEHHDCAALAEQGASLAAIAIDPLALPTPLSSPPPPRPLPPPAPLVIQRPKQRNAAEPESKSEAAPARPPRSPALPPSEPASSEPTSSEPPISPGTLNFGPLEPAEQDLAPPRRPAPKLRAVLGASGGLALNLFPNPAPQIRASLGLRRPFERAAVQVQLDGEALLAGRFRSADGLAGGDLIAWDLALRPCGIPRWGIVDLRLCASVGAGQIRARSVGIDNGIDRTHPWVWLGAQAGVAVELQRNVALLLDLDARFSVYRPSFSVSSPDASYLTPITAGLARLGVELRFP